MHATKYRFYHKNEKFDAWHFPKANVYALFVLPLLWAKLGNHYRGVVNIQSSQCHVTLRYHVASSDIISVARHCDIIEVT
ncbi:unnamed protein product [Ixodes persulcatus]